MKKSPLKSFPSLALFGLGLAALPVVADAQTPTTWMGTATWDTVNTANWTNGVPVSGAAGVEATFASTGNTTVPIVSTGVSSAGIAFAASGPAYTFNGGALTLDNGATTGSTTSVIIADSSTATETFNQTVIVNDSASTNTTYQFGGSGSVLAFNGGFTLGNNIGLTSVTGATGQTVTFGGLFTNNNSSATKALALTAAGSTLNWNATALSGTQVLDIQNYGTTASQNTTTLTTDPGNRAVFGGSTGYGGIITLTTSGLTINSAITESGATSTANNLETFGVNLGSTQGFVTANTAIALPTSAALTETFQLNAQNASNALSLIQPISAGNATTTTLQKIGAGTVVSTGANSYKAVATNISAGTLVLTAAGGLGTSTAVNVASGASLEYQGGNTPLAVTGTLAVTGGTGTTLGGAIGSTTTGAEILVAGAATATGAVNVNVFGTGLNPVTGTNTYTLVSGGTGSSLSGATYTLGNVYNSTNFTVSPGTLAATGTALTVGITSATALANETYVGGFTGAPGVLSASDGASASNWTSGSTAGGAATSLVPGAGAVMNFVSGSNATATTLGANMSVTGINVTDPAGLVINGDGFTLTLANSANALTVAAGAGQVTLGCALFNGGSTSTLTNNSSNPVDITGFFTIHGVTLAGAGGFSITGETSFNGTVTINSGTGSVSFGNMFTTNNTLGITNNSANTVTVGGQVTLGLPNASTGLIIGGTGNTVINNSIVTAAGATNNAVTKNGTGMLTLSAPSLYTPATIINAGTLQLTNTSGSATGTSAITLGAATLSGTGAAAGVVTAAGTTSIITPATTASVGTLTLGGIAATSGLTLNIAIDGPGATNSNVTLTGAFTAGGTLTLNLYDLGTNSLLTNTIYNLTVGSGAGTAPATISAALIGSSYSLDPSYGTYGDGVAFNASTDTLSFRLVPEPSTWAMMLIGGLSILALAYRRRAFSR